MGRFACWAQLPLQWRGALRGLVFVGLLGAAVLGIAAQLGGITPYFLQVSHAPGHWFGRQYTHVVNLDTKTDNPTASLTAFVAPSDLQSQLPGYEDAATEHAETPVAPTNPPAAGTPPSASSPRHAEMPHRIGRYLTWLSALLMVGAIAVAIQRNVGATPPTHIYIDHTPVLPSTATSAAAQPSSVNHASITTAPLLDATAIAAQGNFALAIHTLLLRTLGALAHASAVPIGDAMTSREILASVALPPRAAAALAELVAVVERTHFGTAAPTETDFAACRAQYEIFRRNYNEPAQAAEGIEAQARQDPSFPTES